MASPSGCPLQWCAVQHHITSSHQETHLKTQLLFPDSRLWFTQHMKHVWAQTKPIQYSSHPMCSPVISIHFGLHAMKSKPADSCVSACTQGSELMLTDCREEAEHQTLRVWYVSLIGWNQEWDLRKRLGRPGWVKGEAGLVLLESKSMDKINVGNT